MSDLNTDFPAPQNNYIKASDFQDTTLEFTYLGWKKKANEDDPKDKKNAKTWKQKVKYMLRYTYPEFATDEANEKMLGRDGEPFQNRNWDENFPHGYSIVISFEEGDFETGSLPLWNAFCRARPSKGERVFISRTGEGTDTKWSVKTSKPQADVPEIQINDNELQPDSEVPF